MTKAHLIHVRISQTLMNHINTRKDTMKCNVSEFITYLLQKDIENSADESLFWKEKIDSQINKFQKDIEELKTLRDNLS